MRVSQAEKDKSHARIVQTAARLIRERGPETTSVADVMTGAGLTHGGFYRHFGNKDALTEAALDAAFEQILGALDARLKSDTPPGALAGFKDLYLSEAHVGHPGLGCPIAAIAGEVARGTMALKQVFGKGVERLVARMAMGMPGAEARRREHAIRQLAMMAGAVMIARASDPQTAQSVLVACRSEGASHDEVAQDHS